MSTRVSWDRQGFGSVPDTTCLACLCERGWCRSPDVDSVEEPYQANELRNAGMTLVDAAMKRVVLEEIQMKWNAARSTPTEFSSSQGCLDV